MGDRDLPRWTKNKRAVSIAVGQGALRDGERSQIETGLAERGWLAAVQNRGASRRIVLLPKKGTATPQALVRVRQLARQHDRQHRQGSPACFGDNGAHRPGPCRWTQRSKNSRRTEGQLAKAQRRAVGTIEQLLATPPPAGDRVAAEVAAITRMTRFAPVSSVRLPYFPPISFVEAVERYLTFEWDDYDAYEEHLESVAEGVVAAHGLTVEIAEVDIDDFEAWCDANGVDPDTSDARAGYPGADGETLAYAPGAFRALGIADVAAMATAGLADARGLSDEEVLDGGERIEDHLMEAADERVRDVAILTFACAPGEGGPVAALVTDLDLCRGGDGGVASCCPSDS